LFSDERLRALPAALATVPDPQKRRGRRYDVPFSLLCLVAALLCDCNSLEAVDAGSSHGPRARVRPVGGT